MVFQWTPARSMEEVSKMLEAPGSPLETKWMTIKDRHVKVFVNQPASMRDIWVSTKDVDADYIVYDGERYTYKQAHVQAAAVANLLQSYGVKKGDRVVICMRNFPEFIFLLWGIQAIGAVIVGVNAWSPFAALKHCVMNTTPVLVFLDQERATTLAGVINEIKGNGAKEVFVVRSPQILPGFAKYEPAIAKFQNTSYPEVEILPEDHSIIYYTSGTTSLPKGVFSTQRQTCALLMISASGAARSALRRGEGFPEPDPTLTQRAFLVGTPLFHVTGLSFLMGATASAGKLVLIPKWDTAKAVELIKNEKVTGSGGVPFIAQEIMNRLATDPNHSLEMMAFGGGPSPENLPEFLQKNLGKGLKVAQAYGMTETNSTCIYNGEEDYVSRPKSTGVPSPINQIKIRHLETQEEVPVGTPGEIYLWGSNVAEGYWNDPKATKEAFLADAWYRTGDVGYLDKDGFLYISDRAKEIIIRGGENISSAHVESKLFDHPSVREAAVMPLPDEKLTEVVGAVVTLKPGYEKVTEAELIAHVTKLLPKHEVPVMVWIRDEDMPRNPSKKILKTELKPLLREQYAARLNKPVLAKL